MLKARLQDAFRWLDGDPSDPADYADPTRWWRDPDLLAELGPALAGLFPDSSPDVIVGPQSRGSLLGPLVALHLGIGFVEIQKDPAPVADDDAWVEVSTIPDYRDRTLRLGVQRSFYWKGRNVLFVDDWVDTGAQLEASHRLIQRAGGSWLGASVIVNAAEQSHFRGELNLRSLLHIRDL